VTATDSGGETTSEDFTITINDINEAPTAMSLSNASVDESHYGKEVGTVSVTDPDSGNTKTSYPFLENAYDDFIVLPEIGDFENETNTVTDASELPDLLIDDPIDEDMMFLLQNFTGDDIITKPTIGMTENNHDEVKEYDLFFNFDQYDFQEGLIYISELG
ncbi:MAG: hypothetical protein ABGX51_05115, partial [Gammaproteobacteria bacterium]